MLMVKESQEPSSLNLHFLDDEAEGEQYMVSLEGHLMLLNGHMIG